VANEQLPVVNQLTPIAYSQLPVSNEQPPVPIQQPPTESKSDVAIDVPPQPEIPPAIKK
jgi:hypothetical protein